MGSREFKLRLVELVAVSIHSLAVTLFSLEPKSHTPEYIEYVTKWEEPAGWEYWGDEGLKGRSWHEPTWPRPPTLFRTAHCTDSDIYPNGVADLAGYWAEDRIFGGVFVFDRGQSGTESNDIFLDQDRKHETIYIWSLSPSRLDELVDFLLGKISLTDNPLPFFATDNPLTRFNSWDAIALYHIFRDPWERRIPAKKPPGRECGENDALPGPDNRMRPREKDLSWIIGMGGQIGIPLLHRPLPYIGPPESDRKRSPSKSPSLDSDDASSSVGKGQQPRLSYLELYPISKNRKNGLFHMEIIDCEFNGSKDRDSDDKTAAVVDTNTEVGQDSVEKGAVVEEPAVIEQKAMGCSEVNSPQCSPSKSSSRDGDDVSSSTDKAQQPQLSYRELHPISECHRNGRFYMKIIDNEFEYKVEDGDDKTAAVADTNPEVGQDSAEKDVVVEQPAAIE